MRAVDAREIVLAVGHVEQLLELLQQRLRLELGLDGNLVGERDQQAAALDEPGEDLAVAALLHWLPSLPSFSWRLQSTIRAWAPAASASGNLVAARHIG